MGLHGAIEFGNRLLTFVLAAVALATLVVAWRMRPARRDVRRLALLLSLSIPAQALIGGVVVLTQLNPWTVMLHFLASIVLVGLATVLIRRAVEGDDPPTPVAGVLLRRMALITLVVAGATVYAGSVVTGTGPHAGDQDARRTGLDLLMVTQLHADLVFLLVGLSIGLVVLAYALHAPRRTVRAAWVLVAVEAAQASIGYTQYFTGLPIAGGGGAHARLGPARGCGRRRLAGHQVAGGAVGVRPRPWHRREQPPRRPRRRHAPRRRRVRCPAGAHDAHPARPRRRVT